MWERSGSDGAEITANPCGGRAVENRAGLHINVLHCRAAGLGGYADGEPAEDPPHLCDAHLHQADQVPFL